ncbi:MAG: FadR family transcriptional regulator [Gammaproteobacteria bacterium]|nr:FadR family transcriptional regulator [Gammaproteobacteria bacterium]
MIADDNSAAIDSKPTSGSGRKSKGNRIGVTTSAVAAQLKRRILEGNYAYEERLPAERNLAEEFEVSRGTIRSVLQILEQQHLVTRQIGSGTYVTHREITNQQEISSVTSPLEMNEVRIAIEPQMVRLAIANASSRELDELRDALRQCESCGGDPEKFARGDAAFHMALAHCSRNKLMYWLYERISEVRQYSQWRTMKAKLLTAERINFYNGQHRNLYEAIVARDTASAVQLIKDHLYGVHDDLLETD